MRMADKDSTCLPDTRWLQAPGQKTTLGVENLGSLCLPDAGARPWDPGCRVRGYRSRACRINFDLRGRSASSDAPVVSSVRCSVQIPPFFTLELPFHTVSHFRGSFVCAAGDARAVASLSTIGTGVTPVQMSP